MKKQHIVVLVVLVFLGGLFALLLPNIGLMQMGSTDITNLLPERCLSGAEFSCESFEITSSEVSFELTNLLSSPVSFEELSASSEEFSFGECVYPEALNPDESGVFSCPIVNSSFSDGSASIVLEGEYLSEGSRFSSRLDMELFIRVD